MTTENRTVIQKEKSGGELYKKTPAEKAELKKAKAEHKKAMKNGGKA
jgi:hypothetical protein